MVVTLPTANRWLNSDGLMVKFGIAEADRQGAFVGTYATPSTGGYITEAVVNLATVAGTAASVTTPYLLSDSVSIPNGAYIEYVDTWVLVETAGANANLDFGLIDQDMTTELDFNGLLAAADIFNAGTDLNLHTKYEVGTTEVGALVGTVLTNTGLLTCNFDTAAFTAGRLRMLVKWFMPAVPNAP